jgi:hypothetical protein
MVNLSRARDAAMALAVADLNQQERQEMRAGASPMRLGDCPAIPLRSSDMSTLTLSSDSDKTPNAWLVGLEGCGRAWGPRLEHASIDLSRSPHSARASGYSSRAVRAKITA